MTISSWLNFGRPALPWRCSAAGEFFLAPTYYSQRAVFASLRALFHFLLFRVCHVAWRCNLPPSTCGGALKLSLSFCIYLYMFTAAKEEMFYLVLILSVCWQYNSKSCWRILRIIIFFWIFFSGEVRCVTSKNQWCNQDSFQDQDQDQDLNFKTEAKTRTLKFFQDQLRPRRSLVFKTKTKTLDLKTKTKTFLWCILEADRKAFFIFGRKRKCRRKWTSVYEKKTKMDIHFRPKNENESHLIILVFFFCFSYIQSPSQPYTMRCQYLFLFRLFAGGPWWWDSTFLMYSV